MAGHAFYLEGVPQAALQSIVRHLSERPSAPDWQSYVLPKDAQMAMHSSCVLSATAGTCFTHVRDTSFLESDASGTLCLQVEHPDNDIHPRCGLDSITLFL